jgi:hypothetical protein
MKSLFLLSLLIFSSLAAQPVLHLQLGLSPRTSSIIPFQSNNSLTDSWKDGLSAALSSEFPIHKSISLSPGVEYNHYPFDNLFDQVTIPEQKLMYSSGDAAYIYRFFVDAKLFDSRLDKLSFCLLTGINYNIEKYGEITAAYSDMNGPDFKIVYPSHMYYYWMHSIGAGLRYFFSRGYGFDLTAKLYTDYDRRNQTALHLGLLVKL